MTNRVQSLDQGQAEQVAQALEHLGNTDSHDVVVWDGEVTLATKDGVMLGTAWYHADLEMWLFRAYDTGGTA